MSTVNETEHPESTASPEQPEGTGGTERPEGAEPTPAEEPAAADRPEDEITAVYVRRRRTPTLGFWVILALLAPAVAALLLSPLFAFDDLSGVLNFMLLAAVVVGLPLAAIACLVDAIRHRTPRPPRH